MSGTSTVYLVRAPFGGGPVKIGVMAALEIVRQELGKHLDELGIPTPKVSQ